MDRSTLSLRRMSATLLAATVVTAAAVHWNTAAAAPTVRVAGNATVVTLSQDFANALGALGVAPGTLGLSVLADGKAYFPISAGALDAATARGEIHHLGGLTLTAGSIRVELSDFLIDTTGTPRLTGLVVANGDVVGRLPLFALTLPPLTLPVQPAGRLIRLPGVGVALTGEAAAALNGVFGVSAFVAGFPIGTAEVRAVVRSNAGAAHLHVPRGRDLFD